MATAYQTESFGSVYQDALPLLQLHWQEIARFKDVPLEPDVDLYRAAECAGRLRIYTARNEGALIGYAVYYVSSAAHYKSHIEARQDVVFIHPDFRRGRVGIKLLQFADEELRKDGVGAVYHHVKVSHPALGGVLTYLGYEHVENIYVRRL